MARFPLAGTTAVYHTSALFGYVPQEGGPIPAVGVAQAVPVGEKVQLVPTANACAVHGLSFAVAVGPASRAISMVPQLAGVVLQPGNGPLTRMK
ncbi:MAG: hypothetical protein R2818_13180 [Flavobacteriales bacterium]